MIGDACIYIEYVERILKCGWNELEHTEWLLGGIVNSKIVYDPKNKMNRLKEEFAAYPERLRKMRIIKLSDDAAMYNWFVKNQIKRGDYVAAAHYLRNAVLHMAYLLFPLNGKYFLTERNLIQRVINLDNVPEGFNNLFRSILFDLKPDEESINLALKSSIRMLENLQKSFDYLRFRREFGIPVC